MLIPDISRSNRMNIHTATKDLNCHLLLEGNYKIRNIMRSCYKLHISNVKKEFSSEAVLVTSVYDIAIPCNTWQVSC